MRQDEIEKAKALSDWYKKLAENKNGWTIDIEGDDSSCIRGSGPNMWSDLSIYLINEPKPESKIIDMSICIGSNIDVEFYSDLARYWYVVKLTGISERGYLSSNSSSSKCRLRENHWYTHNGCKSRPIPEGFKIEVCCLNGASTDLCYGIYNNYLDESFNWDVVVKYRIIEKLPEYKYD